MKIILLLCLALGASLTPLQAQEPVYPTKKAIKWVVALPPGGTADPLTRKIAEILSKKINQTIYIENKPGANQALAKGEVYRAEADGYTLLTIAGPVTTSATHDVGTGLTVITKIADQPMLVAASGKVKENTFAEVIKAAKDNPLAWSFATGGNLSTQHITGELINNSMGTKMNHIPYRGGGQALNDVIGGTVPLIIVGIGPAIEPIKSGLMKGLAITASQRSPALPDVPTLNEVGFKDLNLTQTFSIAIHSETPKAILEKLHSEIIAILNGEEMKQFIAKFAAFPSPEKLEEGTKNNLATQQFWQGLMTKLKLQ